MRTTCIIDNYNHGRFVTAAVESALQQSLPFDEIIVVDDASTDDSQIVLQERYGQHAVVQLIFREENQGQLACLETGILAATGEICCLLDADDLYAPDYLQSVVNVYHTQADVDCVFTSSPQLRKIIEKCLIPGVAQKTGFSVGISLLVNGWIGAPTSCLSFRRQMLQQMFPYPYCFDWKVRADDYLNLNSSIQGALKFYCPENLVTFRWHDQNSSWTCGDAESAYRRRIAMNRLHEFARQELHLNPEYLASDLHREFQTWSAPSWKLLLWYLAAVRRSRLGILRWIPQSVSMLQHFMSCRLTHKSPGKQSVQLSYVPARHRQISASQISHPSPMVKS